MFGASSLFEAFDDDGGDDNKPVSHFKQPTTESILAAEEEVWNDGKEAVEEDLESGGNEGIGEEERFLKMEEELKELRRENKELRKKMRIFTQQPQLKVKSQIDDGPKAHLILFNNGVSNELATELKESVMKIIHKYATNDDDDMSGYSNKPQTSSIQYPPKQLRFQCLNEFNTKRSSKDEKRCSKAYTASYAYQFFNGNFYLDQVGTPAEEKCKFDFEHACLDTMNGEIEEALTGKPEKKKQEKKCWNCGQADHELSACPEPKNYQNIQEARKEFLEHQQNNFSMNNASRYHDDAEDDPRFKNFKAGKISDRLREAMGLKPHQLPIHIYRMRTHGYPPGHIIDAHIQQGLNLYKNSTDHLNNDDQQEVEEQIDLSKLISYPGFNDYLEGGTIDESQQLGFPPMDISKSLNVMRSYFKHKNEIIQSKLDRDSQEEDEPQSQENNKDNHVVDMDVDSDNDEPEQAVTRYDPAASGDNNMSMQQQQQQQGQTTANNNKLPDVDMRSQELLAVLPHPPPPPPPLPHAAPPLPPQLTPPLPPQVAPPLPPQPSLAMPPPITDVDFRHQRPHAHDINDTISKIQAARAAVEQQQQKQKQLAKRKDSGDIEEGELEDEEFVTIDEADASTVTEETAASDDVTSQQREELRDELGVRCDDLTEEEFQMRLELLKKVKQAKKEEEEEASSCTPPSECQTSVGSSPGGVPAREKFAVGITPFRFEECHTPSKGIYQKLKKLLSNKNKQTP